MATKSWNIYDQFNERRRQEITISAQELGLPGCSARFRTLCGGPSDGVELLEIDNGVCRLVVCPTRGMGIHHVECGDWRIGWNSPTCGPVHPKFVPLTDPSGMGWLEGFDELLCRCGLVSNGSPEFNSQGALVYPLHGRIANLPASDISIEADADKRELRVSGTVDESRLFSHHLQLRSTLVLRPGERSFRIEDCVANLSGRPAEMELLYHINFGPPLLEAGARLVVPAKTVVPWTAKFGESADRWDAYGAPGVPPIEQVFFFDLLADSGGQTQTLLRNANGSKGIGMRFNKQQLPRFIVWKHTAALPDGYVTGLEPATNFPNVRTFEKEHGRVKELAPGETAQFEIEFDIYNDRSGVAQAEETIGKLQSQVKPEIIDAAATRLVPVIAGSLGVARHSIHGSFFSLCPCFGDEGSRSVGQQ